MIIYRVEIDGEQAGSFTYVSGIDEALCEKNKEHKERRRRYPNLNAQIGEDFGKRITRWARGGNPVDLTITEPSGRKVLIQGAWVTKYSGASDQIVAIVVNAIEETA